MIQKIFTFNDNPAVGGVSHAFNENDKAVFDPYIKSLDPFQKHYNLPTRNGEETSHNYLLRSISLINKKQNEFLGEEFSLVKTSTPHMLKQINERESIIRDQELNKFCRVIAKRNPGILLDIADAETLQNKAEHWRNQLKTSGSTITQLDMNSVDLKRLPDEISYLTALTDLNLSNNQLQTLPESFGTLTALTDLDLRRKILITVSELFWSIFGQSQIYRFINFYRNNECEVFI